MNRKTRKQAHKDHKAFKRGINRADKDVQDAEWEFCQFHHPEISHQNFIKQPFPLVG